MNKLRILTLLSILIVAGTTACTPPPPLPTVALIPTSTITLTPSITKTPTASDTPTSTFTPTDTPTFTPSDTPTPTVTPTPSDTPTPTNTDTPTATDTPLPTSTRTASATRTPTNTASATVAPSIKLFEVTPRNITAGQQVTVRWNVDADTATLDQLSEGNALIKTENVPIQGQRQVLLDTTYGSIINFRLTITKGGTTVANSISVSVNCASAWFFSPPPPGGGCPQNAMPGAFTMQTFQSGVAFYTPVNNAIYFLAADGSVNGFPNTWNESVPLTPETPPAGFVDPTGPIGNIWKNAAWSDGRRVRDVMGWGTSGPNNYSGILQIGPFSELYISTPSALVYRLGMSGNVGSWTIARS